MIGQFDPSQKPVTVIGAGFSGLLLAWHLDRSGYEVHLYESSDRPGGLIETRQTPFGMAEGAAHSFRATRPVRELCAELGVELAPVKTKKRFIFHQGRLQKMPLNPLELAGMIWRAATRPTLEDYQSFQDWALRHVGPAATDRLITPMVNGIYAADPKDMRVEMAFPNLLPPAGQTLAGHFLRTRILRHSQDKAHMMAPAQGMQDLCDKLADTLQQSLGPRFHLNAPVEDLPDFPNIALCTPAAVTADLIGDVDPESARALRAVPYQPLISVTLFVEKQTAPEIEGIGVLNAPDSGCHSLGILFNSATFDGRVGTKETGPEKHHSLTMILGGAHNPGILDASPDQLRQAVEEDLSRILGITDGIVHLEPTYWPAAIPLYGDQLKQAWQRLEQGWANKPGHVVFGNYTGAVSLRGMVEEIVRLN